MLAVATFTSLPSVSTGGDGQFSEIPNDGVRDASYTLDLEAGEGPLALRGVVNPETGFLERWERSQGSFNVSGTLAIRIDPEEGEVEGTEVGVELDAALYSYFRVGGGIGNTGLTYGLSYSYEDASGVLIKTGAATPKPNEAEGDDGGAYGNSFSTLAYENPDSTTLLVPIGETVEITFNISGRANTWQGGYFSVPFHRDAGDEAAGTLHTFIEVGVKVERVPPPDLEVISLRVSEDSPSVVGSYTVQGKIGEDVEAGLFWSTIPDPYSSSDLGFTEVTYKAKDIAISTIPGSYDINVPLTDLTPAPEEGGYKYLVFYLDPFKDLQTDPKKSGEIDESIESDNGASIQRFAAPEVEIEFSDDTLRWKDPYSIYAVVRNNSLGADTFDLHLNKITDYSTDQLVSYRQIVGGGPATDGRLTVSVPPLQERKVLLQTVVDQWDWIPKVNPATVAETLANAVESAAVAGIVRFANGIRVYAGDAIELYALKHSFQQHVDSGIPRELINPTHPIKFELRATGYNTVENNDGFVSDQVRKTIEVPKQRQDYFKNFARDYRVGSFGIAQGVGVLLGGGPLFVGTGLSLIAGGIGALINANDAYENAKDPPDPVFTEYAALTPIQPTLPVGFEDELARSVIDSTLLAASLRVAAARSVDKHDGARIAGDPYWQAEQLLVASQFSRQASLAYANNAGLLALQESIVQHQLDGIPSAAFDGLVDVGLPIDSLEMLQGFGFTSEQIYQLELGLEGMAAESIASLASGDQRVMAIAASVDLAVSSIEELQAAIEIRVNELNQTVQPLDSAAVQAMAAEQARMLSQLNDSAPNGNLFLDIADFIDQVQQQIISSNNFAGYREQLVNAYELLISFQSLLLSTAEVTALVEEATTQGKVDEAFSGVLLGDLIIVSQAIRATNYSVAVEHLDNLISEINSRLGTEVEASTATHLSGHLGLLSNFLVHSSYRPGPVAVDDVALGASVDPLKIDVLSNDGFDGEGPLRLIAAGGATHGTVVIDDNGTPDFYQDDTVSYTPHADYQEDTFYYVVGADSSTETATGQVAIQQPMPTGTEVIIEVAPGLTEHRRFMGSAGDIVAFKFDVNDYDVPSIYLNSPGGDRTYISHYDRLVLSHLEEDGIYTIDFDAQNASSSQDISLEFVKASDIDLLTLGTSVTLEVDATSSNLGWSGELNRLEEPNDGRLLIDVQAAAGMAAPYIQLFTYNSETQAFDSSSVWAGQTIFVDPAISGPFFIEAYQYADNLGTVQLSLESTTEAAGSFSIGEIVGGAIQSDGERVTYSFEGTAGQSLFFDSMDGTDWNLYWEILSPSGQHLFDPSYGSRYAYYDSNGFSLLESGTHQLRIWSDYAGPFDYRFRLFDVEDAPPIETGGTYTSTLNGEQSSLGMADFYQFTASAGETRIFTSDSYTSALGGPYGTEVLTNWAIYEKSLDGGFFKRNSKTIDQGLHDVFLQGGTYLLKVSSENIDPASVEFRLLDNPTTVTQAIEIGETVIASIDEPLKQYEYEIELIEGQLLLFAPVDSPSSQLFLESRAPSETLVMTTSASLTAVFRASETGTFTISIQGMSATVEDVTTFGIFDLSLVSASLPVGVQTSTTIGSNEVKAFVWNGSRDDRLAFSGSSSNSYTYWTVYDSLGNALNARQPVSDPFAIDLPEDGNIYLIVHNADGEPSDVSFEPELVTPEQYSYTLGEMVQSSLSLGEVVDYHFDLSAGQLVYFDSLSSRGGYLNAQLFTPSGSEFRRYSPAVDGYSIGVAPESGMYTLRIKSRLGNADSYAFRLIDFDSAPLATPGSPIADSSAPSAAEISPTRHKSVFRVHVQPNNIYEIAASSGQIHESPRVFDANGTYVNRHYDPLADRWAFQVSHGGQATTYFILVDSGDPNDNDPEQGPIELLLTEISNTPPVAGDDERWMLEGGSITLALLANDQDSEGALDSSSIVLVTHPMYGDAVVSEYGQLTYTPATTFTGIENFTYTVADSLGVISNEATVTIHVAPNTAPVAVDDYFNLVVGTDGTSPPLYLFYNDQDPDLNIDWGSLHIESHPQSGFLQIEAGLVQYTSNPGFEGQDHFTYTVRDYFDEVSNVATVTLDVQENTLPIAVDDFATVLNTEQVEIDLLENDSDPNLNLDFDSVRLITSPPVGQFVEEYGYLTYIPEPEFSGDVFFEYVVKDALGTESNIAVVTITVLSNSPPIATDDTIVVILEEQTFIDVLANDYDSTGEIDRSSINIVEYPENGTLVVWGDTFISDDDGSPVGNGYASGLAGVVDDSGTLEFLVSSYPDYSFVGDHTDYGDYVLYIMLGQNEFPEPAGLVPDLEVYGLISEGTVNTHVFNDLPSNTPYVAWIDNTVGDSWPDTVMAQESSKAGVAYQANNGYTGQDSFTYTISDESGLVSEPASVVIQVQSNEVKLPGDYTNNGVVDTEDYLTWKAYFGATTEPGLQADGNGDGIVNLADYTIWRNNLGATLPTPDPPPLEASEQNSLAVALAADSSPAMSTESTAAAYRAAIAAPLEIPSDSHPASGAPWGSSYSLLRQAETDGLIDRRQAVRQLDDAYNIIKGNDSPILLPLSGSGPLEMSVAELVSQIAFEELNLESSELDDILSNELWEKNSA
ncbi:Ig-like domain-containing protein [Aeoliella sp.]|uniref:Ig-like domain-containing protein n=1 Tax=Aeoliella sp. TaxID=2795800 RepID=UPI003CCB8A6C